MSLLGDLPANLQGIWNKEFLQAWDSKFTINLNTQMNYWPAEICNLPECHIPLFDHIKRMKHNGKETVKKMYGSRGFVAYHNTDIWVDTAPQEHHIPASYWPMEAAWFSLHLWEYYQFTKDTDFLNEHYSIMNEAALFFIDFLVEDSEGHLINTPSVSPENTYVLPDGSKGTLTEGPSMDSQIIFSLFSSCIEASKLLDIDDQFRTKLLDMIHKLPKPTIGKHGQIQEWLEDYDEVDPGASAYIAFICSVSRESNN